MEETLYTNHGFADSSAFGRAEFTVYADTEDRLAPSTSSIDQSNSGRSPSPHLVSILQQKQLQTCPSLPLGWTYLSGIQR